MKVLIKIDGYLMADVIAFCVKKMKFRVRVVHDLTNIHSVIKSFRPLIIIVDDDIIVKSLENPIDELKTKITLYEDLRFIIILKDASVDFTSLAMNYNVYGFLHSNSTFNELNECIQKVADKEIYISEVLLKKNNNCTINIPKLSSCEKKIASLVATGYSTSFIAKSLNISENTVKNHRKNIKIKVSIAGGKNSLIKYLKMMFFLK